MKMTTEDKKETKTWIVHLSTYPPRECGIATFTQDLVNAFDELYLPREESKVVAMNADDVTHYNYPRRVIHYIRQNTKEDYVQAAHVINDMSHAKLVNIQHEFGIYGGEDGEFLIDFLREIKKPVSVTCHTVLPGPNDHIKKVAIDVISFAQRVFVMSENSKKLLVETYGIEEKKIKVIPHGIHSMPYTKGLKSKAALGLSGKLVLTTFGLLSRGKGIENALDALPSIVKEFPNVRYLIIGATHPVVLINEGEEYRNFLTKKVIDLGLKDNVVFYNQYLETTKLLQFLDATDIYMSLSQNPNQAVSGTLSYALGAGRPVISTCFAQAKEEITPEVGFLVDFQDPKGIEHSVLTLLRDPAIREAMGRNAYFLTRNRTWPNVALSYMQEFIEIAPTLKLKEKNLPRIKLQHLEHMTDDFGMLQFANLTDPDPASGYTLDDNARALIAATLFYELCGGVTPLKLIEVYINFLSVALKDNGTFQNYINYDHSDPKERNKSENLDDANARAFYSLAFASNSDKLPEAIKEKANSILRRVLVPNLSHSPRAVAFYIKGFYEIMKHEPSEKYHFLLRTYSAFLSDLYRDQNTPDWHWFEDTMTYSNGVLCEAMLKSYILLKDQNFFDIAKASLDFLVTHSFNEEICVPIGQAGWFKKGGKKGLHDQQPEEVAALVEALKTMYEISKEEKYNYQKRLTFSWFLGNNLLKQVVYDQASGGCFDGLGEKQVNLNQGAESTVMYLIARLQM